MTQQIRQSAAMGPVGETSDSMSFAPRWKWPLATALTRRMRGEKINLEFRASDLGTTVAVTGKVADDAESVASREFWAKTLPAA